MSAMAYLTLTGAKQGAIKGGVTAKGREDTIALTAFQYQVQTSIDPSSGTATGKRQHSPIMITKLIDQATPQLYEAFVSNETLTSATIALWGPLPDGSGTETQYFTITLTNALLVAATLSSPNVQDPSNMTGPSYEELQFVFQTITLTWVNGGITAQDTWTTS